VSDVTSPCCDCGARRQTVAHILLHCSKRRDLRNRIFANLSGRDNLRTILGTPQLATKAIEYIEQTQILGQNGDRRRVDENRALGGRLKVLQTQNTRQPCLYEPRSTVFS
jgi:hypothetical protein